MKQPIKFDGFDDGYEDFLTVFDKEFNRRIPFLLGTHIHAML
jgi:hypothetical protein